MFGSHRAEVVENPYRPTPLRGGQCGKLPEKLMDLEGKLSLTIHDVSGASHAGTYVSLNCYGDPNTVGTQWGLIIKLSSNTQEEEEKIFWEKEIVNITRYS